MPQVRPVATVSPCSCNGVCAPDVRLLPPIPLDTVFFVLPTTSDQFNAIHPPYVYKMLEEYYIGGALYCLAVLPCSTT